MKLKGFLNKYGLSLQVWDFWPRYVVTIWFGPGIRLRPRVYYWRGKRRV